MDDPTRLEPTAALVMLWSRDRYRSGSAGRFYARLDLSDGEPMRTECDAACPWYHQVTLNRKWCIHHRASHFIAGADGPCQVILPAAGKSPLALELLDDLDDRIAAVIECDISGMEGKQLLYEETAPEFAGKISCVTADLFDLPGVMERIHATGMFDPRLPTVVIPEGISYYIPPALLAGVTRLFASPHGTNRVICDYLLPCSLVAEERRRYPRGVWRVINRDCNHRPTVTYSPDAMGELLTGAGCTKVVHHSMHAIERQRTGRNEYFPTVADGWIGIAEGWL